MAVLVLAVTMLLPGTALASSASTTVSLEVAAVTTLTNNCTHPDAFQLGVAWAGMKLTTATDANVCSFSFGATNDTARLRLRQADADGNAMAMRDAGTWQLGRTSAKLNAVSAASSTVAWAVGSSTTVLLTTDGGQTWTRPAGVPSMPMMRAVHAIDENRAWFAGNSGTIVKYDTGTWTVYGAAQTGVSTTLRAIHGTDMSTAVAGGSGNTMVRTTNGGTSWSANTSVAPVATAFYDIAMSNSTAGVGCVAATSGRMMRTTDGGASWTDVPLAGAPSFYGVTQLPGTNTWVAVGANGAAWRSTDNCQSFTAQTTNVAFEHLYDVTAGSGTHVYAIGDFGVLIRSTNGGTSWSRVTTPQYVSFSGVSVAAGATQPIAVGSGRTAIYSADSGTTWQLSTGTDIDQNGAFTDVDAVDANIAWAVGGRGSIARTIDGGATWTDQPSGVTSHLFGVAAVDANRAWAVGADGLVLRTTDGGSTWTTQTIGSGTWRAIHALRSDRIFVAGDGGTVLTWDGSSWTTRTTSTALTLYGISAADEDVVWAVGASGRIIRSDDGGVTWANQTSGTTRTLLSVSAVSPTLAWVSGDQTIRRSTDGTTWAAVTGAPSARHTEVKGFDANVAYVASLASMLSTTTGSSPWGNEVVGTATQDLMALAAVDRNTVFVAGDPHELRRSTIAAEVDDYALGTFDWGTPDAGMFGACLQAVDLATTAAAWTRDTANTAGRCEPLDSDPWYPVPAMALPDAASTVARTLAVGDQGRADLVFGFRPAASQPFGQYTASVAVEVVAPGL